MALLSVLLCTVACASDESSGDDSIGEGFTETAGEDLGPVVVEVVLGARHSCARLESGAVECWGADGAGQLGNGEPLEDSPYPVAVAGFDEAIVALSADGGHSCALDEGGGVSCWGLDVSGQLGDGEGNFDQAAPVGVFGLGAKVQHIGTGSSTSCATTDSELVCWGGDFFGQVGDGEDWVNPTSPVPLAGLVGLPQAVDLSERAGCVILDSGEVQCWGQCWFGTLGNGISMLDDCYLQEAPEDRVQLSGLAQAIAVGDTHACALLDSGEVQCWGSNRFGQLGTGDDLEYSDVPIDVPISGSATGLVSSKNFTCALLEDGEVWCWGENVEGQLGLGVAGEPHFRPERVTGLAGPVEVIAAGAWHACAIVEGGKLQCWGADHRGQLGDGPPFESRSVPGEVLGLGEGLEGNVTDPAGDACAQPDPGLDLPASVGAPVVHWTSIDQYGDEFELCALGGKAIIIDISPAWCPPCQGVAAWLAGDDNGRQLTPYAVLRDMVSRGDLHWVTLMPEGPESEPATVEDAASWHDEYPNDQVSVVIDPQREIVPGQFWVQGYPGYGVIDPAFHWADLDGSLLFASEKFGP